MMSNYAFLLACAEPSRFRAKRMTIMRSVVNNVRANVIMEPVRVALRSL